MATLTATKIAAANRNAGRIRDRKTQAQVATIFTELEKDTEKKVAQLAEAVAKQVQAGKPITNKFLMENGLADIQKQVLREGGKWAVKAEAAINEARAKAVAQGKKAAEKKVAAVQRTSKTAEAMTAIDESKVVLVASALPLKKYINKTLYYTTGRLAKEIIKASKSRNVRNATDSSKILQAFKTAVKAAAAAGAARMYAITSTETSRAQRLAEKEVFKQAQEDGIVKGWIWQAFDGACDYCIEQDGTEHSAEEDIADMTHVSCRCEMMPVPDNDPKDFDQLEQELDF